MGNGKKILCRIFLIKKEVKIKIKKKKIRKQSALDEVFPTKPGHALVYRKSEDNKTYMTSGRLRWIKDSLSGASYQNQPCWELRLKLFFLGVSLGVIGNAITLTINALYRIFKVFSFAHFTWSISDIAQENLDDSSYHLKRRCVACAKDIARIVVTPLAFIGLFFAGFMGVIDPREHGPSDWAKIFSSIEIAMYGGRSKKGYFFNSHWAWAPCLQPDANMHLLGGDINKTGQF